ncbi:MAG: NAD-dependent epimerase/dehydratase family protein [Campylobacterales bacterium]
MHVLVTGSKGFIGKNLIDRLTHIKGISIETFDKDNTIDELSQKISKVDFIFHLAGVNRPDNIKEFYKGNRDLTKQIIDLIDANHKKIPILLSSSIQVERDNDYGKSKLQAEELLKEYASISHVPVYIYRLPNVFGKWCKPNYNSVIATWCYNIAHDLPIQVNDPSVALNLVYIDNVIEHFISHLKIQRNDNDNVLFECHIKPIYKKTLGEIKELLFSFKNMEYQGIINQTGFEKALYDTYISYVNIKEEDARL